MIHLAQAAGPLCLTRVWETPGQKEESDHSPASLSPRLGLPGEAESTSLKTGSNPSSTSSLVCQLCKLVFVFVVYCCVTILPQT